MTFSPLIRQLYVFSLLARKSHFSCEFSGIFIEIIVSRLRKDANIMSVNSCVYTKYLTAYIMSL